MREFPYKGCSFSFITLVSKKSREELIGDFRPRFFLNVYDARGISEGEIHSLWSLICKCMY